MNDLAEQMLAAWQNPFATDYDPRHLLKLGADEIRRLQKLVQDYVAIAKSSSLEIKTLREAAGLPADGLSGWEATTDSPEDERAA